jgi:peptidyl-prolyl cis-trans isomerase D
MAIISAIRKRSGVIIGLITLSLIGFLAMDATTGKGSLFGNSQPTDIAKVGSESLSASDFETTMKVLFPREEPEEMYSNRSQAYNFLMNNALINQEAGALGLGVGSTELSDLTFGNNPHPLIGNLLNGQMTREGIDQLKQAVNSNTNPELKPIWAKTTELIKADKTQEKLQTIIERSVMVPKWMATVLAADQNKTLDFQFVRVPFDKVADTEVKVEDADISAYIAENAARFNADEERRQMSFLSFDVVPSAADSAIALGKINELVATLGTAQGDSSYILANGGVFSQSPNGYVAADKVSPALVPYLNSLPIGGAAGPFFDDKAYNAVKLLEKTSFADSVKLRHILIGVNEQRTDAVASMLADSLLGVINAAGGANFAALVTQYSDDPGSKNTGGEYTFPYTANLYKNFYDYAFKTGAVGAISKVKTQEGGYHIIQILGKAAGVPVYRYATLRQPIDPGKETIAAVQRKADKLLSENTNLAALEKAAKAQNLNLQETQPVMGGDFNLGVLGQGSVAREMVRWAYSKEAKAGVVAPTKFIFFDPRDQYETRVVLAGLKKVIPAGLPSVKDLREDLEPVVRNKKKGVLLAAKMKGKDLTALATEFGGQVDTVGAAGFATSFTPALGNEPKVIGTVFGTAQGQNSAPIVGEAGVFVVRPTAVNTNPTPADPTMVAMQMRANLRQQIAGGAVRSMKKAYDVKDNRATFPGM